MCEPGHTRAKYKAGSEWCLGGGGRPEIRRNTLRSRRQSDFNKIGSPCERLVHFRDPNSLTAPPYESREGKVRAFRRGEFPPYFGFSCGAPAILRTLRRIFAHRTFQTGANHDT
jgi:hypothetical protein